MSAAAYAARTYLWPPAEGAKLQDLQERETPGARLTQGPEQPAQSVFSQAATSVARAVPSPEVQRALVNRQHTRACLQTVEAGLARKIQYPVGIISPIDRAHLGALVALANAENPDMNARVVDCWEGDESRGWPGFRETVEKLMQEGTQSARFLVSRADPNHVVAADYRLVGDRASIIAVEPAKTEYFSPAMLHIALHTQFNGNPKIAFVTIDAAVQKSPAGCGMFSYSLMKQIFKEHERFQALHERHLAGELPVNSDGVIETAAADALLPPLLMKHAQSRARLRRYLQVRPEMATHPVNKKGESLTERQARSLVTGTGADGKTVTYDGAIEEKRRVYLARLLNA